MQHGEGYFLLLLLVSLCAFACEEKPTLHAQEKSVLPQPPTPEAPRVVPWFQGEWTGVFSMQMGADALEKDKAERRPEKKRQKSETDESSPSTFEARVRISIDQEGRIEGTLRGEKVAGKSLTMAASGVLDDEALRLRLVGAQSSGTFIAERKEGVFVGNLRLSVTSSEGNVAKQSSWGGMVSLERQDE